MRTTIRKTGLAAAALTLSVGLAACGNEADDAATDEPTAAETSPSEEMSESETEDAGAGAQTFGAGCAEVPTSGAGSFDGMVTEPVATAASANPLLSTLVTAVGEAGLVDTLNGAEGITVFAPANPAFEAFSKKQLNGLLADKETLTAVLTHHVVEGQLSPEDVAGTHTTLNGDELTVEGSGEEFTVGDEGANVICGNIPTANATVYVIDGVLMP